jgi:hypothetical protein
MNRTRFTAPDEYRRKPPDGFDGSCTDSQLFGHVESHWFMQGKFGNHVQNLGSFVDQELGTQPSTVQCLRGNTF